MRHGVCFLVGLFVGFCLVVSSLAEEKPVVRPPIAFDAVGSWFGLGEAQGPVPDGFPATVSMLLSFNEDGVLLGTDSTNFGVYQGLTGSPAHGSWAQSGLLGISGTFLWLQYTPDGNLVSYVKVKMEAHMEDFRTMSGSLYPELFPDLAVNPLASDSSGIPLGRFDFLALRIVPEATVASEN